MKRRLVTESWLPYQGHCSKVVTRWANLVVISDQHKALTDTTELTDTVYFVHPTGIQTLNPWVSKQRHCIFALC